MLPNLGSPRLGTQVLFEAHLPGSPPSPAATLSGPNPAQQVSNVGYVTVASLAISPPPVFAVSRFLSSLGPLY